MLYFQDFTPKCIYIVYSQLVLGFELDDYSLKNRIAKLTGGTNKQQMSHDAEPG
jgi:hypothetical protein